MQFRSNNKGACHVLLHCEDKMDAHVAAVIAAWLHWYIGLDVQEAVSAVEVGLEAQVDQVGLRCCYLASLTQATHLLSAMGT